MRRPTAKVVAEPSFLVLNFDASDLRNDLLELFLDAIARTTEKGNDNDDDSERWRGKLVSIAKRKKRRSGGQQDAHKGRK